MSEREQNSKMKIMLAKCFTTGTLCVWDTLADYFATVWYILMGHYTLAVCTCVFMVFSSIVSIMESVKWHKPRSPSNNPAEDSLPLDQNRQQPPVSEPACDTFFYKRWLTHQDWYVRYPWRVFVTLTQGAIIASAWSSFVTAWRSLGWNSSDPQTPEEKKALRKKAKEEWQHCQTLNFIDCRLERIIQLTIQLSFVMHQAPPQFEYDFLEQYWPQIMSIVASSLSIMFALWNHFASKYSYEMTDEDGKPLPDSHCKGYIGLQYTLHLLILVSRVFLFSAVFSVSLSWALGVLFLHWSIMAAAYRSRECTGGKWIIASNAWTLCWVHLYHEEKGPSGSYYGKFYGFYVFQFAVLLRIYVDEVSAIGLPFFYDVLIAVLLFTFFGGLWLAYEYYHILKQNLVRGTNHTVNTNSDSDTIFKSTSGVTPVDAGQPGSSQLPTGNQTNTQTTKRAKISPQMLQTRV